MRYYSPMDRLRLLLGLVPFFATACAMSEPAAPEILLFNGRGTSPNDVAAVSYTHLTLPTIYSV